MQDIETPWPPESLGTQETLKNLETVLEIFENSGHLKQFRFLRKRHIWSNVHATRHNLILCHPESCYDKRFKKLANIRHTLLC